MKDRKENISILDTISVMKMWKLFLVGMGVEWGRGGSDFLLNKIALLLSILFL